LRIQGDYLGGDRDGRNKVMLLTGDGVQAGDTRSQSPSSISTAYRCSRTARRLRERD